MMKLIIENIDQFETISEAVGDKKNLYIRGVFMQTETVNKNGRMYPKGMMEEEVNRYMVESVQNNMAIGELNHPPTPALNPERAAILTTELKLEGNDFIGKAKVLSTPMGTIVRNLIEDGVRLGVSSRGVGQIKENRTKGFNEVSAFHLCTPADVVSNPSAPKAFVRGVMESADYWLDPTTHQWVAETTHEMRKDMRKMTVPELEAKAGALFESFLATLVKSSNR